MLIVTWGRGTIEADLQRHTISRQGAQNFQPSPDKKHSVSQHGGRGGRGASHQNVTDVGKEERLAAGDENLAHTECRRFPRDLPHSFGAERASRRLRRRAYATIITA